MVILCIVLTLVGIMIWAHIVVKLINELDHKESEEKVKAVKQLMEQNDLTKHYVYVLTKTGKIFVTALYEPISYYGGGMYIDRQTSLDQAKNSIERSINSGRFYDRETNTYVPLCEIEYFKVQQFEKGRTDGQ